MRTFKLLCYNFGKIYGEKNWAPYAIDSIKHTFWNVVHLMLNRIMLVFKKITLNVDGIHGTMQELITRQNSFMLKNHHETAKYYMELKVINKYYKALTNKMDSFLLNTTSFFWISGYALIYKRYYVSLTLIPILNDDGIMGFHSSQNDEVISVIFKNQNDIVRVTFQLQKWCNINITFQYTEKMIYQKWINVAIRKKGYHSHLIMVLICHPKYIHLILVWIIMKIILKFLILIMIMKRNWVYIWWKFG